jgi:hypothetical protein
MKPDLTEPQRRALRHLVKYPEQWRQDTPTTQLCLNNLRSKGFVKVAFDKDKEGWCEMITQEGIDALCSTLDPKSCRKNRVNAAAPEPHPAPGKVDIWPLVLDDIKARVEAGQAKYGTVLQSRNGRDALMDAYQEAIDLVLYLRQLIEERNDNEPKK